LHPTTVADNAPDRRGETPRREVWAESTYLSLRRNSSPPYLPASEPQPARLNDGRFQLPLRAAVDHPGPGDHPGAAGFSRPDAGPLARSQLLAKHRLGHPAAGARRAGVVGYVRPALPA